MHVSVRPWPSEGDFGPLARPRETHLLSRKVFRSPRWVTFATHPPLRQAREIWGAAKRIVRVVVVRRAASVHIAEIVGVRRIDRAQPHIDCQGATLHGTVPDVHPRKARWGLSPLFVAAQHSLNELILPRDRLACPLSHVVQLLRSPLSGHELAAGRLKRTLGIPA